MKFKSFLILTLGISVIFTQLVSVSASTNKETLWIVTDSSGVEWCQFPFAFSETDATIAAIKKTSGKGGEYVLCSDYKLSSTDPVVISTYTVGFPSGNTTLDGRKICMEKGKESPCVSTSTSSITNSSASGGSDIVPIPRKRNIKRYQATSETVQMDTGSLSQSGSIASSGTVSTSIPMKISQKNVTIDETFGGIFAIFAAIGTALSLLPIIFFLLMAWGLYLINKKSGEQYPWLAFIPLVQIYSFVKAGGKDGIWVLWLILGYMALVIPGLVLTIMVIHGISKRTGNGAGSTILAIFFPYIMYPIMGSNMVDSSVKTESIPL